MTKATNKAGECKLKVLQAQGRERLRQGAVFWPYSWRSELCTCTDCKVGHEIKLDYSADNKHQATILQLLTLLTVLIHLCPLLWYTEGLRGC